jgi:hypothetical protein
MAQTNYTPISLYYSTTASAVPTAANLVPGELAINTNDGKLYYEDSSGVVQVLATKSTGSIGGSTTQVQYNLSGSLAGSANLTFDGTNLTTGGTNTATRFIPSGSTVATNGMYLPAANTLGFSTNSTERMRIDSSGNLGLGVTPSAWGSVAYTAMQFPSGGSLSSYKPNNAPIIHLSSNLYYDDTNDRYVINGAATRYSQNQGVHSWSNAASGTAGNTITFTQAMTLDASGNLLVGTTSALSQTGIATFVGTGNGLVTRVGNSSTAYQSTNTSGTSAYYGAIWSNNGNTFSTCGTIQISGTSTSYNTSSDYRLKEDVQPMTGALAKVSQLKPVTYKWKADGSDGQGFIAHELAEVMPDCVSGQKDAVKADGSIMPQGVDTSFLVATLTKAIQEQQALIESLTTRLTALENK